MKGQRSGSVRMRRRLLLAIACFLFLFFVIFWKHVRDSGSKASGVNNMSVGSPKEIRRRQPDAVPTTRQQRSLSAIPKPTLLADAQLPSGALIDLPPDHVEKQQMFFNPFTCEEEPVVSSSPSSSELRFFSLSSGITMLRPVGDGLRKLYTPNDALVIEDERDSVAFSVARSNPSASNSMTASPLIDGDDGAPAPQLICQPPNPASKPASALSWVAGDMHVGIRFVEKQNRVDRSAPNAPEVLLSFTPGRRIRFFGLPSRGAGVELGTQSRVSLMNLDVNHYELRESANLYGSVPLVYAVDDTPDTSAAGAEGVKPPPHTVGFFWLNGSPTSIETSSDVSSLAQTLTFRSIDGGVKLFLLPGPTPLDVLKQYYFLTGHPMLPPLFSLGYHQCRWSYRDQADVLGVNKGFDDREIPVDAIWLDIDHTNGLRYFTFDRQKFPDPVAMQKKLGQSGNRKLVTITDPHIKTDQSYHVYQEAHQKRFFVRTSIDERSDDFKGHCWPGQSSWIDFANPAARSWYSSLFAYKRYDGSTPSLFAWNDMNEPSVFSGPQLTLPMESGHFGGVEHRQLHNLYGFYQTMATFGGHLHRSDGKQRPFVLTRSFFAGSQRYAAVWTGDNQAQWSHLEGSISMLLMHSLGGIPFIGADVGGFFDHPSEELLVRWYQLGSLYPFFRGHSHTETPRREPWLFSSKTNVKIAQAIRFRYCLMPYLYTAFWKAHMFGDAVFRPLMLGYPHDRNVYGVKDMFLVGSELLAKPAVTEHLQVVDVSDFPATGCRGPCTFFDFWTGVSASYAHPATVQVGLDDPRNLIVTPLFVKESAIIPLRVWVPSIQTTASVSPLELKVALSPLTAKATGELYLDDGETTRFAEEDESCLVQLHAELHVATKVLEVYGSIVRSECSYFPQEALVVDRVTVMGLKQALGAQSSIPSTAACIADGFNGQAPQTCAFTALSGDGGMILLDNFHLPVVHRDSALHKDGSSASSATEEERGAGVGSSRSSLTFKITVSL